MKFSFVTKLSLFSTFMLTTLSVMIGVSVWNMAQLSGSFSEVSDVMLPAVRKLTLVDMYHEGVEATVYRSIAAGFRKDEKAAKESREILEEYKALTKECLDTVAGLPLRPKAKANVKPVREAFTAYIALAEEMVNAAVAGKLKDSAADIAEFERQFEAVEVLMKNFAEDVENDVKTTGALRSHARRCTFAYQDFSDQIEYFSL